jgi:DNA helicase-2/ATP-dependent DNA helicase PcrA
MTLQNAHRIAQTFEQNFEQVLQSLTAEQRKAVEKIEGPVMVIAGPGTGKTHILAARIGRILQQTDTAAQHILCLTFTEAGVQAMRERLVQLIGPEGHRVQVHTFHSFCNRVIQEHLELFGRTELQPLSALERVIFVRKLLSELEHTHLLRRQAAPFQYERHLLDLFRLMKTEGWTVAKVHETIEIYLTQLPEREAYKYKQSRKGDYEKGDLKLGEINAERERMERLRVAAALYPRFQQLMKAEGRYDFDDMILNVANAFKLYPNLLRQYQEQFLYILVDEFQDTNGSQNEILQQLIGFWDNPNIFIVGDDDQAIYEFQGARLKNIKDFYEAYKNDLEIIVLKDNFRSSQPILDIAKQLIDFNALRIINEIRGQHQHLNNNDLQTLEKTLTAATPRLHAKLPRVVEYPTRAHELADIVQQIEAHQAAGRPLSNIAVLYFKHRQADELVTLLHKKGIPYHLKRAQNILDIVLIQQLRKLLAFLWAEYSRPKTSVNLLFEILHYHFFNIQLKDIQSLAAFLRNQSYVESLENLDDEENIEIAQIQTHVYKNTWYDVIFKGQKLWQQENIYLERGEKIENFAHLMRRLIYEIPNVSVPQLIERLINQSGLLRKVTQSENKIWLMQVLHAFTSFVQEEANKKPRLTLGEFLAQLDALDRHSLGIELQKSGQHTEGGGVQLLTAHSAKGLEFERVFVMDCVAEMWEKSRRNASNRFALPDTLTFTESENELEAKRRLFYVAMTRAKSFLQISYSKNDYREKSLQRTQFIDEIFDINKNLDEADKILFEQRQIDEDILFENRVGLLEEKPQIEVVEEAYLTEWLSKFQLSVSGLNQFLKCKLGFYFEYVLRVPKVAGQAALLGNAAHQALQRAFLEMKRSKNQAFPPTGEFVRYFERAMERARAHFEPAEFERRLAQGRSYIKNFYEKNVDMWNKEVLVERTYVAEVDGAMLRGVIDKIEFRSNGTAHICDYKTGKYRKSDFSALKRDEPTSGGAYRRQLIFYKILYESVRKDGVRVTSGEIQYLEPNWEGQFNSEKLTFDPSEVGLLRGVIRKAWQQIQQRDFRQGCGKSDCYWCNFTRQNMVRDSFSNEITEAFDDE